MKRLIPAGAIFIVIVIICVLSNISVQKTIKSTKAEIVECETLYLEGQFEKAQESAISFKEKWKKSASTVSVYSSHCLLDDISILSAVLPEAIEERNSFEVNSTISQIKISLDTILEEQSLTVKSLY